MQEIKPIIVDLKENPNPWLRIQKLKQRQYSFPGLFDNLNPQKQKINISIPKDNILETNFKLNNNIKKMETNNNTKQLTCMSKSCVK